MKKLRKGDPVMVIAGKHKGKISKVDNLVTKLVKRKGKTLEQTYVYLQGVNEVKKAVKGQGFVTKTLPLHASNVMYHSEKHNAPIKLKIAVDGKKKTRVSKKYTEKID